MHWPLDNSARAQGSEEHIMAVFSATLFAAAPALGYLLGLTGSVTGLWLSYAADLPPAPPWWRCWACCRCWRSPCDPLRRSNNRGAYVLTEQTVYHEHADAAQGLALFLRYGVANDAVNRFDSYLQFGAVYTGLIPSRNIDQLGLSWGRAHNGGTYRKFRIYANCQVGVHPMTYPAGAHFSNFPHAFYMRGGMFDFIHDFWLDAINQTQPNRFGCIFHDE